MAMDAAQIEQLIKEALPDAEVRIEDLRGDGDHYAAYVRSTAFTGKSRVTAASDGLCRAQGAHGWRIARPSPANLPSRQLRRKPHLLVR